MKALCDKCGFLMAPHRAIEITDGRGTRKPRKERLQLCGRHREEFWKMVEGFTEARP